LRESSFAAAFGDGTSNLCNSGGGTLFSFSSGLAPFVKAVPRSGAPGSTIKTLGNNLTGGTTEPIRVTRLSDVPCATVRQLMK